MNISLPDLKKMVGHVEGLRDQRLPEWMELSKYLLPSRGRFPGEEKNGLRNKKRFNNTGSRAIRRAAAGMTEGMTPASLPWFRHDFLDRGQREIAGSREYADTVDERLRAILEAGGFYQAIHAFNQELLTFGCALLYQEESMATVARWECPTIGTWAIATNRAGELACVVQRMQFTVRELIDTFGESNVSERTRTQLEHRPYEPVDVVHVVIQNTGADSRRMDARSMPWASLWYEEQENENFLRRSGYNEMPFYFTVWQEARGLYGVGPGDEAISDQKAVETYELYKSMGLEKTIDPPVLFPGSLKDRPDTRPGAKNSSPLGGQNQVVPLYQINFGQALPYVQQEIQNIAQRMDDSLMASVFTSIAMDQRPPNMTATEYMSRRRESMQQMGPALSAYEPKVLNKVLERTFAMADRLGLMPDPPGDLGDRFILDVQYLGPMSQALRQTGSDTTRQLLEDVAGIAQLNPEVLDKIDLDQAVDELARGIAAPGSVVRSDDDVAAIRQARAEQQAAQQQAMLDLEAQKNQIAAMNVRTEGTVAGKMMGE